MSDLKPLLERADRAVADVPLPAGGLEGIERRRARKQRNRRIREGAVGVIVALATAAALARSFGSDRVPADRLPPLGAGEVLTVRNEGLAARIGDLIAQDPDSGETRTIVKESALPPREGTPKEITSAAWSPDHRWVAFRASALWLADTVGGAPRQLNPDQGWDPWAWSPTEDKIAVVNGRHVTLFDAATGRETDLGNAGPEDNEGVAVHNLVWSPDGTRIAYDGGPGWGTVYSIDVESGEHSLLVRQPAGTGQIKDIDWSPDGAHVAITYEDASREGAEALYLASADGSHARLVDRTSARPWPVFTPGKSVGTAWSPDGSRLAYTSLSGSGDSQVLQVWTVPADGSAPSLVVSPCCLVDAPGLGPVWSPDGSQVAFATLDSSAHGYSLGDIRYLVVDADGTGDPIQIDDLVYQSWAGGWYFSFSYG
jgi:Tol biopolymer transport system component